MCSCHSIPECCVMFSGVKLSMGSFVLFLAFRQEIDQLPGVDLFPEEAEIVSLAQSNLTSSRTHTSNT